MDVQLADPSLLFAPAIPQGVSIQSTPSVWLLLGVLLSLLLLLWWLYRPEPVDHTPTAYPLTDQ